MKPRFTICRFGAQDKVADVSAIITDSDFSKICKRLTRQSDYEVKWVDERIRGKMFTFETDTRIYYITYTPRVAGRNSYLQSVPTAFGIYLNESVNYDKESIFCLYFSTSTSGNQTRYHQLMYRLLMSVGVTFINADEGLRGLNLLPYSSVRELITDRESNRSRNAGNQSSYITDEGKYYHIYGKTFGANQKETTMLCMAMCCISDKPIRLFQIADNESEYLSDNDINAIQLFSQNFGVASIKIYGDTYVFGDEEEKPKTSAPDEETLRSPRFIFNLLEKTGGHKCCALCNCEIESIVQGAHIYPVYAIKQRDDLNPSEKLKMAIDKDNGLWLCENHHKLFDRGLIRFEKGKLQVMPKLSPTDADFVNTISTNKEIKEEYYTPEMDDFFALRDEFYRSEKIY